MITSVNAIDRNGDAQVNVQINDQHNFHFVMSREAIFDFLEGESEGVLSAAEALQQNWDQFRPALERVLRTYGTRFEVLTTEMLNP
ncbi:hypothetical protein BUE93_20835 [Chromobacterium amazonense]|uniref:Uncharacterized protein n=1 Tax=Chromobacterium amazonense TaxID=1382803 RepID=A0A2S9WZ26_9NEIS|nr:hypothetical protein [Chromobacterium amazonense]PRP68714.1 hypothetical protein BUE93_20835 [Chromobacterium amazonense]